MVQSLGLNWNLSDIPKIEGAAVLTLSDADREDRRPNMTKRQTLGDLPDELEAFLVYLESQGYSQPLDDLGRESVVGAYFDLDPALMAAELADFREEVMTSLAYKWQSSPEVVWDLATALGFEVSELQDVIDSWTNELRTFYAPQTEAPEETPNTQP